MHSSNTSRNPITDEEQLSSSARSHPHLDPAELAEQYRVGAAMLAPPGDVICAALRRAPLDSAEADAEALRASVTMVLERLWASGALHPATRHERLTGIRSREVNEDLRDVLHEAEDFAELILRRKQVHRATPTLADDIARVIAGFLPWPSQQSDPVELREQRLDPSELWEYI
ncbi:hypothetical protein AB1K54_16745 [Microbacterium sp. BWT-B31]|uniref:hypothetical protein n=1 Tax=Microbacterium sp. BWT-B31 TaxID=3232072 RepID=UPI003526F6BB